MRPIRVLVVDDSAFMRHAVTRVLAGVEGIEVVGAANDGAHGLRAAAELHPDVITLDVEMPVLDGLGMLRRLMVEQPARVVMLSSLTTEGAAVTLDALELGAIDFAPKPSGSLSVDIGRIGDELVAKVQAAAAVPEGVFLRHRTAALARIRQRAPLADAAGTGAAAAASSAWTAARQAAAGGATGRLAAGAVMTGARAQKLVVVASSTGGPGTLQTLFSGLPSHLGAGVVVVQHMPPGFTASLAARLASIGNLPVDEATNGAMVADDRALMAAGGTHLVTSSGGHAQLVNLPPVNGVRPAADVTLQAVAPTWRERCLAVILTGMGFDGREGCRAVKAHGGTVFAQDEATSVVWGMPGSVVSAGLADKVLPLERMAEAITRWVSGGAAARVSDAAGSRTSSVPATTDQTIAIASRRVPAA